MPIRLYKEKKRRVIKTKRIDIPVRIFAINKHSIIRLERWRLWKDALVFINWVRSKAIIETNTQPNEIPIKTFW